jgi:hypothetical protein
MRRRWHFYDLQTGLFIGRSHGGDERSLALNMPEGVGAMEHVADWQSQRVDLETGELVDWQPPPPSSDHEWIEATRRWERKADLVAQEVESGKAAAAIESAERQQARAVREALLDLLPKDHPARERLAAADEAIAAERRKLKPGPT